MENHLYRACTKLGAGDRAELAALLRGGTDLMLRIGNGDRAVWDELLRRYGKVASATVRSFRLQEADPLDAIQTTWLRLAEHAE